jgi:hypothetical protein
MQGVKKFVKTERLTRSKIRQLCVGHDPFDPPGYDFDFENTMRKMKSDWLLNQEVVLEAYSRLPNPKRPCHGALMCSEQSRKIQNPIPPRLHESDVHQRNRKGEMKMNNDELKETIDDHETASDFVQALERFVKKGFDDLAASNSPGFQHAAQLLEAGLSTVRLQVELEPQLVVRVYLHCKEADGHPDTQLFCMKLGTAELNLPSASAHLN